MKKPNNKFELHLMMESVEQGVQIVGAASGEWKPQGFKEMTDAELDKMAAMILSVTNALGMELSLREQSRKAN